ncbi:MAG: lytic transglycosylase domain-containing protein, partial [Dehalococcoidia bacterium]
YLSDQLKQFGGDPYRALAAYNGGPGTASNAAKSAGDNEDLFVEDLEFDETRAYVRRVMENYARYRQLYQGINRPSLPR